MTTPTVTPAAPGTSATLSVVVPVYFNEDSLPELALELERVERDLLALGIALELIFVDDGSGDASLARLFEIKQARPATRIVKLTRNFGAVQASKTGYRFVTGDCFLSLAADLQDPPELIVEAARRWQAGSKYVIFVRSARADGRRTSVFAGIYYRLLRLVAVPGYPSTGYDLALMDKQMLPFMRDSAKNINNALYAFWLGFKPEAIQYARRPRRREAPAPEERPHEAEIEAEMGEEVTRERR